MSSWAEFSDRGRFSDWERAHITEGYRQRDHLVDRIVNFLPRPGQDEKSYESALKHQKRELAWINWALWDIFEKRGLTAPGIPKPE